MGTNLHEIEFCNDFLDNDTKTISNRRKNKLDVIKIKKLANIKGHYHRSAK